MSTGPILERIDDFDERLDGMRSELDELRRGVEAVHLTSTEPEVDRFEPAPATAPAPIPAPVEHTPSRPEPARPSQPSESGTVAPPYEPAFTLPSFSVSDLLGARTLAWAGGLVTLLGVVFLFVLAADRGWVGAEERLALGGLLSIGLAGSGMYIKHRYGSLVAALSAMGVGLAAGYLTLTAASATYGLLPVDLGIALASALAALAVGVAMRWRSEILAAFSLGGAMVALPLIQQGFTPLVGTFLALLFAGAAAVAISQGWRWLLITRWSCRPYRGRRCRCRRRGMGQRGLAMARSRAGRGLLAARQRCWCRLCAPRDERYPQPTFARLHPRLCVARNRLDHRLA